MLLQEGGSLCPAANWPNLCADLCLLLGPTAEQVTTGEKVVTESSQQGALQSNYQHKEADIITTWHFIYLDNFNSEERERERDYVPKIYQIQNSKEEKKSVCIVSERTSHRVSLWGLALEGSGMQTAKKMPKKPARLQLRQQRTRHLPWFDCNHLSDSPYHYIVQLSSHSSSPHLPPFFFSPPSGWNVSTHFSLYALCLTDVGERSLWWCCAGEMSRNVRELLMSCNSEKHLCVGMTFKNLSSCKISQNVCTSLFLQIIYSNYLRSVCPNIHISIFVWRFQIVKNVRFEPQLQANSPKPFVLFFSLQSVKSGFVGHLGQSRSWLTPQFANIIKCFDWSVSVQVDIKVWVTSAVWNKLSIEKETWAQKYILSLFNPFSQWK